MKCPYCGYENKDDAVFCTRCGKKLPVPETDKEELTKLAFAYTGIESVSEKIVSENEKTIPVVRNACIAWIRSKETLFHENLKGNQTDPLLESFDNMEKQIVSMDYEERIVSLLHCVEKKNITEISEILNISEDYVRRVLQDAYKKANGIHAEPHFKVKREQKPQSKQTGKEETTLKDTVTSRITSAVRSKTAWKLEMIVACIAAVLLGCYFGISSYANTQYESGMELYQDGNYEEAVSALSKAVRFQGGGDQAVLYLGDAYYHNHQYDKASEQYETYQSKHPKSKAVKEDLIRTYQKLADQALKKKDNDNALDYLQKEYALDNNTYTYIRIQAVRNGGTYTSETNGTVYDTQARPKEITVSDADSNQLYKVRISYKNGRVSSLKASSGDDSETFDQIQTTGDYTISIFPDLSMQSERDLYEKNRLTERDYLSSDGNDTSIVYDNILNQKGRITSRTFTSDGTEVTDRYTWENGHITEIHRSSADEDLTYANTWKKNLLQKTVITSGDVGEVGRIEYEYDTSGNLTDIIEKHSMLSADEREPFMKDRHIACTYASDGTPLSCTIRTGDNELTGTGTYVKGTGWIMCYIQKGEQ